MKVYIGNTGHIKNHQNFKNFFWSREAEKPIFTIFPESFYEKMGWESGKLETWKCGNQESKNCEKKHIHDRNENRSCPKCVQGPD